MSCPACKNFFGDICPLCECGLQPVQGLNEKILQELGGFLLAGADARGRKMGESILGHAARRVRESAVVLDECPGCGGLPHTDGSSSHDPCPFHYGHPVNPSSLHQAIRLKGDGTMVLEPVSEAQATALTLAQKRGMVSVEDGFTSELLGALHKRGLLKAVTLIDGQVMSAAPVTL